MKAQSPELIHSPVMPEEVCLQCGHEAHDGGSCNARGCLCSVCVRNPDEVVDDETDTN